MTKAELRSLINFKFDELLLFASSTKSQLRAVINKKFDDLLSKEIKGE